MSNENRVESDSGYNELCLYLARYLQSISVGNHAIWERISSEPELINAVEYARPLILDGGMDPDKVIEDFYAQLPSKHY